MLYLIVQPGLNKIFQTYKFSDVCKKFQIFNCENSIVEELRQQLGCEKEKLEYF